MVLSKDEANGMQMDLQKFRIHGNHYSGALQLLSANHDKLLGEYKALLNEYEECKDARDEYKRLVRPGAGNPFVLALIDGDNYPFREEYVRQSANGDGGRIAAGRLWAALTERLSSMDLPVETKVVVKYIVNLSAASVEMHKLGVIGSHSRALAPFAAAFGKEHTLFDVVDSGEMPRATDSKMQDNFRLFIENPSCKHIFFAGCNSVVNVSMITRYERQPERLTLIRNSKSIPTFLTLGLRAVEWPAIFREKPELPPSRRGQSDETSTLGGRNGHPSPTQRTYATDPAARDDESQHNRTLSQDHTTRPAPWKRSTQWRGSPPQAPAVQAEPPTSKGPDKFRPGWQPAKEGKRSGNWAKPLPRSGSGGVRSHVTPAADLDQEPLIDMPSRTASMEDWHNPAVRETPWTYKVLPYGKIPTIINGQGGDNNLSGSHGEGVHGHHSRRDSTGIASIWSNCPASPSVAFDIPEDKASEQQANAHGGTAVDIDHGNTSQAPPAPESPMEGATRPATSNVRLASRVFDTTTGTFGERASVTSHQSSSLDEQRGDGFHSSATMSSTGSTPVSPTIHPIEEKHSVGVDRSNERPSKTVADQDARVPVDPVQIYRQPHHRAESSLGLGFPSTGFPGSGLGSPGLSASRHAPSNFPAGTPTTSGRSYAPSSEPSRHNSPQMSMTGFSMRFGCGIPSDLANNSTDGYKSGGTRNGNGPNGIASDKSKSEYTFSPSPPLPKACTIPSPTTLRAGATAFVPTPTMGQAKDDTNEQPDTPTSTKEGHDDGEDGFGKEAVKGDAR